MALPVSSRVGDVISFTCIYICVTVTSAKKGFDEHY